MSAKYVRVTVYLPERSYKKLEKIVEQGEYAHISEAIRAGVKMLLEKMERMAKKEVVIDYNYVGEDVE